jgi:hypothetical protein
LHSAALAVQYAEAFGEATSAFLLAMKAIAPPQSWRFSNRKASRVTRK